MTAIALLGQGESYARALAEARALRLHHGLAIEGARGTGKSSAALQLAQALLCEAATADAPCAGCSACARVAAGNHPDAHQLTVAEDKHDIGVEQVRELLADLSRRAFSARARVAILDPADRLTDQAQNALLKTLEEPGSNVFLLLPTSRPEALLATVRSRIARLRLRPLAEHELLGLLAQRQIGDAQERPLAAALAGGSCGLACELIAAGVVRLHQHLVALLERPADISAVSTARLLLEGTASRRDAEHRARLVLACARAWLRRQHLESLAQSAGQSYSAAGLATWADVFEILFEAEADLDLRLGAEQVLCSALLRIQQELVQARV